MHSHPIFSDSLDLQAIELNLITKSSRSRTS